MRFMRLYFLLVHASTCTCHIDCIHTAQHSEIFGSGVTENGMHIIWFRLCLYNRYIYALVCMVDISNSVIIVNILTFKKFFFYDLGTHNFIALR